MALLGIDLGAAHLRAAISRQGGAGPHDQWAGQQRMPSLVDVLDEAGKKDPTRVRIKGLIRQLDADPRGVVEVPETTPKDMLSALLRVVRTELEWTSADHDTRCVLAVPSCASERLRSSARLAGIDAGYSAVRLVDDTTAALLGSQHSIVHHKTALVYSWSAAAFSAALYRSDGGPFRLVAQDGTASLGGDEVDTILAVSLLAAMERQLKRGMPLHVSGFLQRLVQVVAKARPMLFAGQSVSLGADSIRDLLPAPDVDGAFVHLAADAVGDRIADLIGGAIRLVEGVLDRESCQWPGLVLGAGEMALLPAVTTAIENRCPSPVVNVGEHAIATGAAMYGALVPEKEWVGGGRTAPKREEVRPEPAAQADRWSSNFLPAIDSAQDQYDGGRVSESIESLDKAFVALSRFSGDLYRKAAAALDANGRYDEALELLKTALAREPLNALLAADFARTCYRKALKERSRKANAKAISAVEEGIASLQLLRDAEVTYGALLAQLLHIKGCALCDAGRLSEAAVEVTQSVRLDPRQDRYKQDLKAIQEALAKPHIKIADVFRGKKISRNTACPCGSGQKYKKCHGR